MHHEVHIELTGHGRGKVIMDGTTVPMVTAIDVSAGVGKVNLVTITTIADQVKLSGPAKVRLVSQASPPSYFEFNHRRTVSRGSLPVIERARP